MKAITRSTPGRSWLAAATVAVGSMTLAFSCTTEELLQVSPARTTVAVVPGKEASVTFQLRIADRKLQSLRLPVEVGVVGPQSVIPAGFKITGAPDLVSIGSRGQAVDATVKIEVPEGTPPATYTALIVPESQTTRLKDGAGIQIQITLAPAPAVTITSPADGAVIGQDTVTIAATVSDPDGNFESWEIKLDGVKISDGKAGEPVTADTASLENGSTHDVEVLATDRDGNTGRAKSRFEVDTEPPTATIDNPQDGVTSNPVIDIAGTIDDAQGNLQGWTLTLDAPDDNPEGGEAIASGVASDPVEATLDTTGLTAGAHTITLTAFDAAGNLSDPANVGFFIDRSGGGTSIIVDSTAPAVAITKPQAGHTYVNDTDVPVPPQPTTTVVGALTATANITNETAQTIELSGVVFTLNGVASPADSVTDGGGGVLVASRHYSSVGTGQRILTVQATDKAGNASLPATVNFSGN